MCHLRQPLAACLLWRTLPSHTMGLGGWELGWVGLVIVGWEGVVVTFVCLAYMF